MSVNPRENPRRDDLASRFTKLWLPIASCYRIRGEPHSEEALGKLREAFMETFQRLTVPLPTLNFIEEESDTAKERKIRSPGLEVGPFVLLVNGKPRDLVLGFLPNPKPHFKLFEERQTGERRELVRVVDATHQQIFDAQLPLEQIRMLGKALRKICGLT